jgi:hypothetical protein
MIHTGSSAVLPSWRAISLLTLTTVPILPALPVPLASHHIEETSSAMMNTSCATAGYLNPNISTLVQQQATVPIEAPVSVTPIVGIKREREIPTLLPVTEVIGQSTSSHGADTDRYFEEAWKLLNTPSFAVDVQGLQGVIEELGLTDQDMLAFCEEAEIEMLVKQLKVLQGRKLMQLFKKWKQLGSK